MIRFSLFLSFFLIKQFYIEKIKLSIYNDENMKRHKNTSKRVIWSDFVCFFPLHPFSDFFFISLHFPKDKFDKYEKHNKICFKDSAEIIFNLVTLFFSHQIMCCKTSFELQKISWYFLWELFLVMSKTQLSDCWVICKETNFSIKSIKAMNISLLQLHDSCYSKEKSL